VEPGYGVPDPTPAAHTAFVNNQSTTRPLIDLNSCLGDALRHSLASSWRQCQPRFHVDNSRHVGSRPARYALK
jgi:hypothetical protein